MTRKVGIILIVFFSLLLIVEILYWESFVKWVRILTMVSTAVFIPLGAALASINSEPVKRSRTKNIYLYSSVFLIVLGTFSKKFQLFGAGIELIAGGLFYTFAYGPLELVHKYQKWLPYSRSKLESLLLSSINFVGFGGVALGWLFKLQNWYLGEEFMTTGTVLLLVGMLAWNFKFTKEVVRRKEAEMQIKEQFEEIRASISYAKRIQAAILPPADLIRKHLPDSFVLYKPKDIVAGDFYWLEPAKDKVFFAVADCTGHGVPGAMVSLVCNNALNRSVREHGLTDPGKILEKTRETVIAEFEKSEEDVKDGMDIALCCIAGNQLTYAGAHNPLWLVRSKEFVAGRLLGGSSLAPANGNADSELRTPNYQLNELKADKQPIGKFDRQLPFTTHIVELQKGDTLYIFSDGFADQFGGENGKKFKASKMKELLVSIQKEPMERQKEMIETAFMDWKGKLEQIDDVCVVGVKF